jgi:hypothetical protein
MKSDGSPERELTFREGLALVGSLALVASLGLNFLMNSVINNREEFITTLKSGQEKAQTDLFHAKDRADFFENRFELFKKDHDRFKVGYEWYKRRYEEQTCAHRGLMLDESQGGPFCLDIKTGGLFKLDVTGASVNTDKSP